MNWIIFFLIPFIFPFIFDFQQFVYDVSKCNFILFGIFQYLNALFFLPKFGKFWVIISQIFSALISFFPLAGILTCKY